MQIINTVSQMKTRAAEWRQSGFSVGLVPTMGYLHDGHMSLVRRSVDINDKTVISIFVNPIQFGINEDLERYPRDLQSDIKKCEAQGVDVIFAPSVKEMYPDGFSSTVDVGDIGEKIAGESRPGHFKGVCTVVMKLFNIVSADRAYFGLKDAQQLTVIKKMATDMNLNTEITGCPTVREKDGLAMSSRNSYLTQKERIKAKEIYRALCHGQEAFSRGEKKSVEIKEAITGHIMKTNGISIKYIEVVDQGSMTIKPDVEPGDLCLISVMIGSTVLIDNIIFGADDAKIT